MKQQILELSLKSDFTFANFWASERYQLIIQKLQHIAHGEILYLWGKPSSGLTHLGQATCHQYQHQGWPSLYLDLTCIPEYHEILLPALEGLKLIVLDNLEHALHDAQSQKLLFDVYNRAVAEGISLVWLAHTPPEQLACPLADLKSRLSASLVLQLPELSDDDKANVLQYCAKQKGLKLPLPIARYLLTYQSRELAKLVTLVENLDREALAQKRKLTIPFIREYLTTQA